MPPQLLGVVSFVTRLLREGETNGKLARPISSASYIALLPTIWALLCANNHTEEEGESTLKTVVEHAIRAGSTSAVKKATIQFIGQLTLVCQARI
jgi:pre-rRNA-processing protein IPI1